MYTTSVPTVLITVGPPMLQVPKTQSLERPAAHCSALEGGGVVALSLQAENNVAAIAREAKILIVIKILF
jgi:hypothetical protein